METIQITQNKFFSHSRKLFMFVLAIIHCIFFMILFFTQLIHIVSYQSILNEKCDLIFLIGCNPASNLPRLLKSLIDLRRRGGKVIVINPLREKGLCNFNVPSDWRSLLFGSKIADVYVQPHIGGDAFLLLGVIVLYYKDLNHKIYV